jgi:hypothetical protein
MECNPNDFMFPMCAEIFYPGVSQNAYGSVTKDWMMDRKISCSFNPAGTAFKEEIKPNVDITQDSLLIGRCREDIRISSLKSANALVNILVTNITDKNGNVIYLETSGPRKGKPTIFEVATVQPFNGPFNTIEYYKIILRRSENQGTKV